MKNVLIVSLSLIVFSCTKNAEKNAQGKWITGTEESKIKTIENQFRGFDMAMVETGYRYQELYWAGQDENWDYADYQLSKIKKTINNGLIRRPKRAKSAEHFLKEALPQMEKALEKRDTAVFNKNFQLLTNSCLGCHAMEKVSYFTVKKPLYRVSPIRK